MDFLSSLSSSLDWRLVLLLIGVFFVVIMILINFFWQKTPQVIREFVNYLNLRKLENIQTVLKYSQYFNRHNSIDWQYAYAGKQEGKEIFFASFTIGDKDYTMFLLKEEVKPMMITNDDTKYEWELTEKHQIAGDDYNFYAKDNYLIEKITNSDDLNILIGDLFKGSLNCLEFTNLNQIILITDYQFTDSKNLIDYFIKFFKLKGKI